MAQFRTLDEFYSRFQEEVLCAADSDTSGWTTEDFLTNVMLEYLEDAGEVTSPVICPFRGYGLQLNAYAIADDFESVTSLSAFTLTLKNLARYLKLMLMLPSSVVFNYITVPLMTFILRFRKTTIPTNLPLLFFKTKPRLRLSASVH